MGNKGTAAAAQAGIATESEKRPLNANMGPGIIAYDDDQIDEWGFLRAAISDLKTPPGPLSDRRIFYGYVLENVKSPRSCAGLPPMESFGETLTRFGAMAIYTVLGNDELAAAYATAPGTAKSLEEFKAQQALRTTSGLVRVRIPELNPLPPPPILPQPADPSQGLCKRSSKALESATNAMVNFYPLFSYNANFENQKFLVPGALVKVEYDQPVVPTTTGPAAPPESPGATTHHGALKGNIMEVMMHESGQPLQAFSAYQNQTQGSEAFGTAEKCQQLLQGAALGFGDEAAGAAPMPSVAPLAKWQKRAAKIPPYSRSGGGGQPHGFEPQQTSDYQLGEVDYSLLGKLDYNTSGPRTSVEFIVLHDTGMSPKRTVNMWSKMAVSSHYVINKHGRIYQLTSERWTTWHAACPKKAKARAAAKGQDIKIYCPLPGTNRRSIGIDLQWSKSQGYTPALHASLAKLLKNISKRQNIPLDDKHVLAHFEVTRGPFRSDPRSKEPGPFDWLSMPGLKYDHSKENPPSEKRAPRVTDANINVT